MPMTVIVAYLELSFCMSFGKKMVTEKFNPFKN